MLNFNLSETRIKMTKNVYNFSAGPAQCDPVAEALMYREVQDFGGTGIPVVALSHRSKEYISIQSGFTDLIRRLLYVPDNYEIIVKQGGATLAFLEMGRNLLGDPNNPTALPIDIIMSGQWAKKWKAQLDPYYKVNVIGSTIKEEGLSRFPLQQELTPSENAAFTAVVHNETIGGMRIPYLPVTGSHLIGDWSSCFLGEPVDWSRYAGIFLGSQKAFGISGATIIILRKDLLGLHTGALAPIEDYGVHAEKESMFNTPPTLTIYLMKKMLEWVEDQGGILEMEIRCKKKAQLLYGAMDDSHGFYISVAEEDHRSTQTIPFLLADDRLIDTFKQEAAQEGLVTLEGHRSVGGLRACSYVGMPVAGVEALVAFMQKFAQKYEG